MHKYRIQVEESCLNSASGCLGSSAHRVNLPSSIIPLAFRGSFLFSISRVCVQVERRHTRILSPHHNPIASFLSSSWKGRMWGVSHRIPVISSVTIYEKGLMCWSRVQSRGEKEIPNRAPLWLRRGWRESRGEDRQCTVYLSTQCIERPNSQLAGNT